MIKRYHILFKKKKKNYPNFYNHGFRVRFMLVFLSIREVYVAKDMVRESKTWATMSLIIWSITDCSEPTTSTLLLFLHGCCETLSSYKYSPHDISMGCQSREQTTAIDQLSTAVSGTEQSSGLLDQGKHYCINVAHGHLVLRQHLKTT